ncbi:hypothetical protein E1171_11715 [Cytophagales bacterium RKSG123]|nr:hypothetical protein [Xanthovirga aplysinae]
MSTEGPTLPPSIELGPDEDESQTEIPQKKRKKSVFYDIKSKKGYTKNISRNKIIIEQFYTIQEFEKISPYVRDIYWYDTKKKSIMVSSLAKVDKDNGLLLHGPYKKVLKENDQTLEEGIFYHGMKNGRWEKYNTKDILTDKEKYYKGWPKDSKISYYDEARTKIKEVIPIEYGKKEGYYYYFLENGRIAVTGEYQFDKKVGIWKEYHLRFNRRKREIQYAKTPFENDFQPYIKKEWDNKGKLIYEQKN